MNVRDLIVSCDYLLTAVLLKYIFVLLIAVCYTLSISFVCLLCNKDVCVYIFWCDILVFLLKLCFVCCCFYCCYLSMRARGWVV